MVATAPMRHLGSVPIPRTRLIGREAERATGRSLLLDEAVPLLTLTGPGGVGKSRLAIAIHTDVANYFSDGVFWVDLAPLGDPSRVPTEVASALGIIAGTHRVDCEEIARHLRPRQTLLLLDNCEHVLSGVANLVATLLTSCPALQVLASSRAPLHVRGEQVLPVEPLTLPVSSASSFETLAQNDSIQLFVERARAVRPGFSLTASNVDTIAAICRALDGLPLAIELAAARITILSPEALLAQMTDRLFVLTDDRAMLQPDSKPSRRQSVGPMTCSPPMSRRSSDPWRYLEAVLRWSRRKPLPRSTQAHRET